MPRGWFRVADDIVLSACASFATARRAYVARIAASLEISEAVVFKPELVAFGEPGDDRICVGFFATVFRRADFSIMIGGG